MPHVVYENGHAIIILAISEFMRELMEWYWECMVVQDHWVSWKEGNRSDHRHQAPRLQHRGRWKSG